MKKTLYGLLFLAFITLVYGANIYQWVDKDGGIHFTDDENLIPPQYRDSAKREKMDIPASHSTSPQKNREEKKDLYGVGEDYWRARVQPWKKQLREATENLRSVSRRMGEREEERSHRYLNRTQWHMLTAERRQLSEERLRYEAQIKEAKEMIEKISKEAMEAKADPRWLQ